MTKIHYIEAFKDKPLVFDYKSYLRDCLKIIKFKISSYPKFPVVKKVNNFFNFIFDLQLDPEILNMYIGIYQSKVIKTIKDYLNEEDVFIDVGANIGFMTAYGASLVGLNGEVHSFEPVPKFFNIMMKNIRLNRNSKFIYANNCAVGDFNGYAQIEISNIQNIGWNTMISGLMKQGTVRENIKVPVIRLDDYLLEKQMQNVSLIKIDVEGYEYNVLKGLNKFFEKNITNLPKLIVEICPNACLQLGYKLDDIERMMKNYNYKAFTLNKKPIDIKKLKKTTDVLYKI